jgi:ketosteroid isomerase-like protein
MPSSATIERLEKDFWQSMVDKDADKAAAMIADPSLVTGPSGTMRMDPQLYKEMTEQGEWTLDRFEFSDVNVIFPNEDTGIIAYKVHQTGTMKGETMDLNCADSSTWVRDGDEWKCALHTETILGQMPLTN